MGVPVSNLSLNSPSSEEVRDSSLPSPSEGTAFGLDLGSDRRADIEFKQGRVANLLQEVGCDVLLLLESDNFAWFTSGATPRGQVDPGASPCMYCTPESRWLVSSNVDTQRMFEEELDGLGFQLKEWPWYRGREQLLADLCCNRKVACDRAFSDAAAEATFNGRVTYVGEQLRLMRRVLMPYEQACLMALGQLLSHALEATCRTMSVKETEREVAAQLSHRLLHRGVLPIQVGVAADGRSRLYRRFGFTSAPVEQYAVLTATARKYGLTCSASRSVCFGEIPAELRNEHVAVCRVNACYTASTWPDAVPREVLLAGRRIYLLSGFEHEWVLAPQGFLTGRAAVELLFTPQTNELFQAGHAVTWNASAGAAVGCDTFLITDAGPKLLTPPEVWPLKRIRVQGAECIRPDILQR